VGVLLNNKIYIIKTKKEVTENPKKNRYKNLITL